MRAAVDGALRECVREARRDRRARRSAGTPRRGRHRVAPAGTARSPARERRSRAAPRRSPRSRARARTGAAGRGSCRCRTLPHWWKSTGRPVSCSSVAVELDRVSEQLHQVVALDELGAEPGSVPGRAARELVLLDERHVAPAEPGEVVQRRDTADTAAHDDDARLGDHPGSLVLARGDDLAEAPPRAAHDLDRLGGLTALERGDEIVAVRGPDLHDRLGVPEVEHAVEARADRREHAPELGVAGRRVDDLVHRVDAGQRLDQLAGRGVRRRAVERRAHGADAVRVEPRHAELVGADHQHLHHAEDVERRLPRERRDAVGAAGELLDEAVGDEALDRLAHRHRAEPEGLGERVDHERIAGCEPARDDRFAQAQEGLVAQVAGVDWGEGRHV